MAAAPEIIPRRLLAPLAFRSTSSGSLIEFVGLKAWISYRSPDQNHSPR